MQEKLLGTVELKISAHPVSYPDALMFMDSKVAEIREKTAAECVWFLEHPPLYTAGTSAKKTDLLNKNFPVYESGRGGQYTYHGPGQRVAYVMVDLYQRDKEPDLKAYIHQLEGWIINALAEFGVVGERREGRVGIWIDLKPYGRFGEAKIAAIGVRVRHWITLHGISINVSPDLDAFNGIVPCGISEHGVTSLADLGIAASLTDLDAALEKHCPFR